MSILSDEVVNDPLARGYAGMTAHQVADSLNTKNRSRERNIIQSYEIIEATVAAEYSALTAAEKERYKVLTGAGQINVKGANTRAAFLAMFAGGTTTRTNLAALQNELISRAEELALPLIRPGDVVEARGS